MEVADSDAGSGEGSPLGSRGAAAGRQAGHRCGRGRRDGAGTSTALACDRIVAASDAVFSTAFTGVGPTGDMGVFASLPARVGPAVARQLMPLPERISGERVGLLGLADALTEPSRALAGALDDARRMASAPPPAVRELRSLLGRRPSDPIDILDHEVDAQARLFDTEDFDEGITAFRERRTSRFAGK